jgi:hypothetical protein
MSSAMHESIRLLFENRPSLAGELLAQVYGIGLPEHERITHGDTSLAGRPFVDYHPDLVLVAERAGRSVVAFIVEGQLRIDERKLRTWPLYLLAQEAMLRCPCYLLVVTPFADVARWASRPIVLAQPGSQVTPMVLGPDSIPMVVDAEEARRAPELAVLSATVHGRGERAVEVAPAALGAAAGLDDDRVTLYDDLVWAALSETARRTLEDLMNLGRYEYQSEHVRRHVEQGRSEGRAEGRAEGKAEGKTEGKAEALLRFLAARRLLPSPEQGETIRSCSDPARLDAWLDRAPHIASVAELLAQ